VDDQFVPLKSTNDIPKRLAWDKSRFATLRQWLDAHLPKLTDLGVVEVSTTTNCLIHLGAGSTCSVSTQDQSFSDTFCLWFVLSKDTPDPKEKEQSLQFRSIWRRGEPVGFVMDGKYYCMTPELVDHAPVRKN
jgi:hypothetical protein